MSADPVAAYMALSPDGRAAHDRNRLGTIRRVVGKAIAHAMLSGDHSRQAMGWHLASALDAQGVEVEYPIRNALKALGADYEQVWVRPAGPTATDNTAPDPGRILSVVVRQLIRMSTHWDDGVRECAREFTRDLDDAGFEIDRRMDELAQETGHGPYLCDMFGLRYDLTKQWADCNGKRWEHTGGWSDVGGPIMRRDEPDGDSMVLAELIRNRGPLYTVVPAPRSPVVRQDELPPF